MLSTRCIVGNLVRLNFWRQPFFLSWTQILLLLNMAVSSINCSSLTAGDRYIRQASDLSSEDSAKDPCYKFENPVNNQFFSPGYPNDYTSNTDCILVLEAPAGYLIKLDFRDYFEIENSPGCQHDFLEVRDGPYGYSDLLDIVCPYRQFPQMLMSKDRYLWIHFKSDENIEYKGFKAVYEFVKRPENGIPEIIPCVMNISDVEEGDFGLEDIDDSIFEFNKRYGAPVDCLWIITVRENWKTYLQFAEFNLEKPNDCATNFVQVFINKTDIYLNEHKEFCGSIAESQLSKANKMYVRFFTETIGKKLKFHANFTAYREVNKALGPCNAEENEFFCEDDTCIHKSLKCNKKYNCRTRFDEEDDECQSVPAMTWSGEHIIIIMVIFSLILTGMCITFLYNCITKLMRDHETIQEYIRHSREQQLNELDKSEQLEKKNPKNSGNHRSRSQSSPSVDSHRFDSVNAINASTPCYVPGGDVLPILIRNEREHSISPSNGDAYTTNIYTVDHESPPQMCDSACQTRESLFTTQEYSSGNSSPQHSVHTDSPPAPFSTFGYKKETKFKAEAKIEVVPNKYQDSAKRRPYSVQTTKSAPDVIVTH